MSFTEQDVYGQLVLAAMKAKWYAPRYPELGDIATALGTDTTTRDQTTQTPPLAVRHGRHQTWFTNSVLVVVNRAKGGNILPARIAAIINGALGQVLPPANTVAPTITYISGGGGAGTIGSQYASNTGTWNPTGTPTRQWLRNGANIAGGTATSYTCVAADGGTNLSCRVTMTNGAGATSAVSNVVAIAEP